MPGTTSNIIRTAEEVVASSGVYSVEALYFLQEGMQRATLAVHGQRAIRSGKADQHVTGQQLCESLRDLALERWGHMAIAVLKLWGITCTLDFGKIVYALIDANIYRKTPRDRLMDFANVYEFEQALVKECRLKLPETIA